MDCYNIVHKEIHIGTSKQLDNKNIMFCGDSKYFKYIGVTLTSVVESNSDSNFVFHIICDDVEDDDINRFQKIAKKYRCTINLYLIETAYIAELQKAVNKESHINVAGLFRIIGFSILEKTVDKVLYMDADILVVGSINEFWKHSLDENEAIVIQDDTGTQEAKRVGVEKYFNSGVMFVDLRKWNAKKNTEKCLQLLFSDKKWIFVDQDVLNIVLNGYCKWFAPKYNCLYNLNRVLLNKYIVLPDFPVIYHFIGATKPWHKCAYNDAVVKEYMRIKTISLWFDNKFIDVEEIKDLKHKWTVFKIMSYQMFRQSKIKSMYYFMKYLKCKVIYKLNL
ncbi:glycosyltransferase family 8 protein [bacterium]|nr:glycosyltransferase family 8 protein [bacterium]